MADAVVKAIVGLRRYGKSSHVVRMIDGTRRVVFYDTLNDDYNEGIVCRSWWGFRELWKRCYRGPFRITYKPEDPVENFSEFCRMAFSCGDCTIVIDEVQLYFRGWSCCGEFTKLITAGGHKQVEVIGVTQMPKRLGEVIRSQAHEWHVFALREETHVKYVVDRCPGLDADLIKTLPKYEYLHFVDWADCYWRCKDNLNGQETTRQRIEYAGQTVGGRLETDPSQHADSGGQMGGEHKNGPESLPGPPGSGDPPANAGPGLLYA